MLQMTEINICYFKGVKCLATTEKTKVIPLSSDQLQFNMNNVQRNLLVDKRTCSNLKLCCQDILSVKLNIYPICANRNCKGKKVIPLPGDITVECPNCTRSMLVTKCQCGLSGEINLEKDSKAFTLTAITEPLNRYFGEDIILKYKNNPHKLEENILLMENVDITHNSKRIILDISNHKKD